MDTAPGPANDAVAETLGVGSSVPIPVLPRVYVPRTRLWQQLDATTESCVRLLVAPVGAGKTLGVGGWARLSTHDEEIRWISGDRSWSDERIRTLLDGSVPASTLGQRRRPLVVVDDAHLLPWSAIKLIDERLHANPDDLRLLLLSRYDLPFHRLVPELLGHFAVIRGDVLRMDETEARTLITEHARTDDDDVADAVNRHAQGWSAAVVLTARAVAASFDPVATAREFADGRTSVAGRLADEVFADLQPRQRHLLLCISGEEHVTGETAAHLTNDEGAGEILGDLESIGLLVSRLPEGWRPVPEQDPVEPEGTPCYRIHRLLSEIVRRRLTAGGVDVARAQGTVRRAVRLDLAAGHPEVAFQRLVALRQYDEAAQVLSEHGATMLVRDHGDGIAAFARHHADAVAAHPDTWLVLAIERWMSEDTDGANHWLEQSATQPAFDGPVERAIVRLLRARLGSEPAGPAIAYARGVVVEHDHAEAHAQSLLPVLVTELGYAQSWSGDLDDAQTTLTTAVTLSHLRGLTTLRATALSHLAMTLHMRGQERASAEVAGEVLEQLEHLTCPPAFIRARAELVIDLAGFSEPQPRMAVEPRRTHPAPVHVGDPLGQFWDRIRAARGALVSGSVIGAERELLRPLPTVALPDHLRVALLVEQGLLASLANNEHALSPLEQQLEELGAHGEAALLAGFRHEIAGDRKAALASFVTAEEDAVHDQPATRPLALTCRAQLQDVLGERAEALDALRDAATMTEVRRNAAPFLGWSRQGTPMETLLKQLIDRSPFAWTSELVAASHDRADIVTALAPVTPLPRERAGAVDGIVRPTLSAREREVLNELARGATYADIAESLFVSENTVKTHVSSLYGKLAVNRRSEALAVARNLQLL